MTSVRARGTGIAPIAFIGSICKGDANVRTFMPFNASSLGAGCLVSTTVAVVDGADDAKAAIEKHRLHVIAIGGLMDDRVNVLRRGEQAGHVENLEARIG